MIPFVVFFTGSLHNQTRLG